MAKAYCAAIGVGLGFVAFIVAVDRLDYPWFGGYWNIVGMSVLNLGFMVGIWRTLRGRKRDPYQADNDRHRFMGFTVRLAVFTSIAATVSVTLSIVSAMLELRPYIPVANGLYFMLIAIVCFPLFQIDGVDFEVYRHEQTVALPALASMLEEELRHVGKLLRLPLHRATDP